MILTSKQIILGLMEDHFVVKNDHMREAGRPHVYQEKAEVSMETLL